MVKTITLDTKVRSIKDDMTEQEIELFESDVDSWGDASDAAQRGALYLDRVMPGWYDHVSINSLSLAAGCSCVLGQIFKSDAQGARLHYLGANDIVVKFEDATGQHLDFDIADNGFVYGLHTLGLKTDSTGARDSDQDPFNAAAFFGFDHTSTYSYHDLQGEWERHIAERQNA